MRDRRQDDRVQIGRECVLYIQGINEIACFVKDISEVGIAFEVDYSEELHKKLKVETEIKFAYYDEFIFLGTEQTAIITAICSIVRIAKKKDKLLIGCKLNADNEIKHYVTQKKVNDFLKKMKKV